MYDKVGNSVIVDMSEIGRRNPGLFEREVCSMSMNLPHTKDNERLALSELKRRVRAQTAIEQVVVFGSVARGEATEESDLDVLVVTKEPVSYLVETAIFDIAFFINIEYDTNISVLVVPKDKWESPVWSLLPLHQAIMREGVAV